MTKEYDTKIYNLAYQFLTNRQNIDDAILDQYLNQADNSYVSTMEDVFFRLMQSLQNANMKANVIGASIGGIEKLKDVVTFTNISQFANEQILLEEIFSKTNPNSNKTLQEHIHDKNSIWHRYVKSLFEAKKFLSQFSGYDDFKKWVDFFDQDDRARHALPMILSNEIYGLGFALACDFLKEIGYISFGKPDVHIKDIFHELKLSISTSDYFVLKDIDRIAKNVGKSSYHVDKLFWLIGSGEFYKSNIKIGRQKKNFIEYVKKEINL